jgi:hypothetical protein
LLSHFSFFDSHFFAARRLRPRTWPNLSAGDSFLILTSYFVLFGSQLVRAKSSILFHSLRLVDAVLHRRAVSDHFQLLATISDGGYAA